MAKIDDYEKRYALLKHMNKVLGGINMLSNTQNLYDVNQTIMTYELDYCLWMMNHTEKVTEKYLDRWQKKISKIFLD